MPLTSVLNYLTYVCPAGSGAGGVDGMDEEPGGQGKATLEEAPAGASGGDNSAEPTPPTPPVAAAHGAGGRQIVDLSSSKDEVLSFTIPRPPPLTRPPVLPLPLHTLPTHGRSYPTSGCP